jgi:hypothetical protein
MQVALLVCKIRFLHLYVHTAARHSHGCTAAGISTNRPQQVPAGMMVVSGFLLVYSALVVPMQVAPH